MKQRYFLRLGGRHIVLALSLAILFLSLVTHSDARSRRVGLSPVQISEVVVSPDPFIIGKSALKLTMLVKLPPSLRGANVLEVSAMITSPTRRTMSFVVHRRLIDEQETKRRNRTVPVELVWDGKDQYHQLVVDGSYFYELQAKLMEDGGNGPRTRIVSHRVHGTLEALAYAGEVLPPLTPEPDIPEELEILREGESSEEDGTVMEEDVNSPDDSVAPGEELLLDATEILESEEAGGLGSDSQIVEPEKNGEGTVPETIEPPIQEFLNEPRPGLPRTVEDLPSAR